MVIVGIVLGTLAGVIRVEDAEEPLSRGDMVVSDHMTAGCPTGELAVTMNKSGFQGSSQALAKVVAAHCTAIAPDTRLVVVAPIEKGAVQVKAASGVAKPLFVTVGDFGLLSRPR